MAKDNRNKTEKKTNIQTTIEVKIMVKIKIPFWTKIHLEKVPLNVTIVKQDLLNV